jgi:hypothetical protein
MQYGYHVGRAAEDSQCGDAAVNAAPNQENGLCKPRIQITEHLQVQKVGWLAGGILAVPLIQCPHHAPSGYPQKLKKLSPKKG